MSVLSIRLPENEQVVLSEVWLIAIYLSLIQRAIQFALECEAKPRRQQNLILIVERAEQHCAFILAADSVSPVEGHESSRTEQANQKESMAVIKMSHECAITGNLEASPPGPEITS